MQRGRDPLADPEALIQRVYSYAAYRIGAGPDAEDVTSETLERALRYRRSYDAKAGSPQAWMLGIARRVVDDHLSRAAIAGSPVGDRVRSDVDEQAATVERLALRGALALLSREERDLLALRYGADLPAGEVAAVMGARTNAVEVALHRAIAKLRVHMSAQASAPEQYRHRA